MPGSGKQTDDWSSQARFAAVVETASLNQHALSEYCRKKGLYPDQIKRWKDDFIEGSEAAGKTRQQTRQEAKQDKKRIKQLERELDRKEKALAETAALLVLRKKLNALWEANEDE